MKHCEISYKAVTFVALLMVTVGGLAILAGPQRAILPSRPTDTVENQPGTAMVLEDVLDGGESIEESAFYHLLEAARQLPGDTSIVSDTQVADLLENPASYRGKPVRLHLRVWIIRQFHPANRINWPDAVQELNCKTLDGQAITVLLTNPQQLHRGNTVVVTGLFYKLHRYQTRANGEDGNPRYALQPLVIGRTAARLETGRDRHGMTLMVGLILLMAIIYIIVRWRVSRTDALIRERRSAG